ncbi:hypothetical protein BFL28_19750 [Sphingomonas turrisvirgatae]|uniref:Uncharacterized protein n=2 Tax=Sphingomonas turrisvirgatae TaxID=1888892 RepID=A0A1E3LSK0_9SPHN|nr:hypothetical protein BFL28_19750 [Sphingomonas turrisvirgatae]
MLAATESAADGAKVTMSVSQFRKLALLLRASAQIAEQELDRFDRPIGGIQFWVPLTHLEAERAKVEQLRQRFEQNRFYCEAA